MTTHRLVVLLVAASFVSAAVAAPQATGSKKDEDSNIIPVDGVTKTSSPAPAVAADPADSSSSSSTSTTSRPATKAPARPALGSGFSRFISDIFQIPISVLRAVNNLLTNPFNRDAAAAAAPKKTDQ